MSDHNLTRAEHTPSRRRALRRSAIAMLMLALAGGSAVVSANLAAPRDPRGNGVAVANAAPIMLPIPVVAHPTPAPAVAPRGTPVAASGGCVNVPIVYYHYIRVDANPVDRLGYQLSVTPGNFQAQMDWLRLAGGHPVTLEQVMAADQSGAPLPSHPIVLTFDDGHDDFATRAVPVLLANHFIATSFIVPGFLNTPTYMTTQQLRQVVADGMVIGAHTMHHVRLSSVSLPLANAEIVGSKEVLQQLIGRAVADFAYPFGALDSGVETLVAQAGFRDAVATTFGTSQCFANRFALHRVEIMGQFSLAAFSAAAGIPAPPRNWIDPGPPAAVSASSSH